MLRSILIYLSQANWARSLVMRIPLSRRVALRFVAGETLDDAVKVVRGINDSGMLATIDLLGEHSATPAEAEIAASKIIETINAIAENQLQAGLSLKLTQIGLMLSRDICEEKLSSIVERASKLGVFIRVDMEEASCLEATLALVDRIRAKGFTNIGTVIQSYLFRSASDVNSLLEKKITIRMVKGAYKESPEIAFPKKIDVDTSFDELVKMMLDDSLSNRKRLKSKPELWPPILAIGSHDEERVRYAESYVKEINLDRKWVEFQMLYGIRRDLQVELIEKGYPVRVYIPFGVDWYPYFMRRLAERPANLWFFLSNLIRR